MVARTCGYGTILVSLLACAFAGDAGAQGCGDVWLQELPSGTNDVRLRTPDGAPVLGGPFSFRVEGALPNAMGALVWSAFEVPVFDPTVQATLYFGVPFDQQLFTTDAEGRSPAMIVVPEVEAFLCGAFAVFQAGVFDPTAAGGVAVSDAVRLRIGDATEVWFQGTRRFDTGPVGDLALADFDGDGLGDIVTVEEGPFQVVLRLGADLDTELVLPSGIGPESVAVADLNGDTLPDLVVANLGSDDLTLLLGVGDGTFGAPLGASTGDGPVSIAIGDLDGDTLEDVAVVNTLSGDISVLLGNGDGSLQPAMQLPVPSGAFLLNVVTGDWNEDGALDLAATGGGPNLVHIFVGNGDGTFASPSSIAIFGGPIALGVGDFDEDSTLDLAVLLHSISKVSILIGNGNGTFSQGATFTAAAPRDVAVADLTLDGHLDLAVSADDVEAKVFRGAGDGTFPTSDLLQGLLSARAMGIADMSGDGRPDLVMANNLVQSQASLVVQVAGKDGSVNIPTASDFALAPSGDLGDVTGDSIPDLVVVDVIGPLDVKAAPGNGDGSFGSPFLVSSIEALDLVTSDLDGDGIEDVVAWDSTGIDVVLGGAFQLVESLACSVESRVIPADADGDGATDLVLMEDLAGQSLISTWIGNGDGTFGTRRSTTTALTSELALGDLDGDGDLDVVHAHFVNGEAAIRMGLGSGFFGAVTTHPSGLHPVEFALGDLNDDGQLDLAATGTYVSSSITSTRLSHSPGNGDGTLQAFTLVPVGGRPGALQTCDINGDALLDVVVSDESRFHLLLGTGAGALRAPIVVQMPVSLFVTTLLKQALVEDVDGDGILDVLTFRSSGKPLLHTNLLGE